jgi:hypothetical protein
MVSKTCRFDDGVCRRVSCDIILVSGEVVLCEYHRNPFGRDSPRKVVPVHGSVFSRRLKRNGVGF